MINTYLCNQLCFFCQAAGRSARLLAWQKNLTLNMMCKKETKSAVAISQSSQLIWVEFLFLFKLVSLRNLVLLR